MLEREYISEELKWKVLRRDNCTCRYCGEQTGPFHMDHVYPVSKGGETSFENLVTACPRCNLQKYDRVGIWPNPIPETMVFQTEKREYRFASLSESDKLFIINSPSADAAKEYSVTPRAVQKWRKLIAKEKVTK